MSTMRKSASKSMSTSKSMSRSAAKSTPKTKVNVSVITPIHAIAAGAALGGVIGFVNHLSAKKTERKLEVLQQSIDDVARETCNFYYCEVMPR